MSGTYEMDITCKNCDFSWAMSADCSDRIFCPYCGKEQPSVGSLTLRIDQIEKDIEELREEIEEFEG